MQRQFLAAAILVALAACSTTAPPEAAVADTSASIAVGASPAPPAPPVAAAEAATLDTVTVAVPRMAARMVAPMSPSPAGFAPVENPEIVVVALVEHGGHGGSITAPIVKDVIKGYYFLKGLKDEQLLEKTQ